MKSTKFILAATAFVAATSFSFAGPGVQYFQQRRAERAPRVAAQQEQAANPAPICCRVLTVEQPAASQKMKRRVRKSECPGCARMEAGERCPV